MPQSAVQKRLYDYGVSIGKQILDGIISAMGDNNKNSSQSPDTEYNERGEME